MPRHPCLDISVWDDGIDLDAWKSKHGIWGVIIKCGGNESGRYKDRCLETHFQKAQAAGLHVGFYYYTTSTTIADAIADAIHCVSLVKGKTFDMPIFMDVEDGRQFQLSKRVLTDIVKAFCDRVQGIGYRAGLYTGGYAFNNNMYSDELRQYVTWIASWQAEWPTYVGNIDMWQQGTKRLGDGTVYYDDVSGCQDFDWAEDSVLDGGGKVPEKWATTIDTCKDPADWAYCTCKIYSCGYSQPKRARLTIELLKAGTAETDCSFGVGFWLYMGGYIDENPEFYTAIERDWLKAHGFYEIDANAGFVKMQRNDVLWKPGHTALYIGDGMQAEALRDENYQAGYEGTIPGDQDGGETVVRALTYDWDYILRKIDPPTPEPEPEPEQEETRMAPFFVRFDGDSTEHLFNPWAGSLRAFKNADEKKSVIWMYQKAGIEIDPKAVDYGSKDSPWGARANDALSRGANFADFEKFEKHPSTRAIIREELAKALDKNVLAEAIAAALE